MNNDIHNLSQNDDQSESSREIGEEHLKSNPDQVLTLESRPISEASSVWDEAESRNEVKRRQQQLQHKVRLLQNLQSETQIYSFKHFGLLYNIVLSYHFITATKTPYSLPPYSKRTIGFKDSH